MLHIFLLIHFWFAHSSQFLRLSVYLYLSNGQFNQHFTRSFYMPRSQKAQKKTDNLTVLVALLGYAGVKASSKMLIKLTPNGIPVLICLSVFPFL